MYLEKRKNTFLVSKLYGKKVKVLCAGGILSMPHIETLTKKIYAHIIEDTSCITFSQQLYTTSHLEYVLMTNTLYSLLLEAGASGLFKDVQLEEKIDICMSYYFSGWLTDFVFHSNRIEGSKTPYEQVKLLMETGDSPYVLKQERYEVINSQKARDFIQKTFSFNQAKIKQLYHILIKNLLREDGYSYPRGYKKEPNIVGNSPTTAPEKVVGDMKLLLHDYKSRKKEQFPIHLALDMHLRFERIHPFKDGNGRTGRMIMNKVLMQAGFLPFIIFSDNRQAYFNVFEKDIKKYYSFMVEQYAKTLKRVPIEIDL